MDNYYSSELSASDNFLGLLPVVIVKGTSLFTGAVRGADPIGYLKELSTEAVHRGCPKVPKNRFRLSGNLSEKDTHAEDRSANVGFA